MSRTLPAQLSSALDAGQGAFYFRAYFDKEITNPNPPPGTIYSAIEIPNLIYCKLERLEIELRTKGVTDTTPHRAVRVERGVRVSGTDYGITSNWYFLTNVDYDIKQQITIWHGHILSHQRITLAGDQPAQTLIAAILDLVDNYYLTNFLGGNRTLTAEYPSHADWWDTLQFLPTGRTLALHRAVNLEALLKQKYLLLMFPADGDKIRFQQGQYNPYHNARGEIWFDYQTLKYTRVIEAHRNDIQDARSFFWRDENRSTHWIGSSSDTPHNMGFMPSTAVPRVGTYPKTSFVVSPPDLRLCGGDLLLATTLGLIIDTVDLIEIWDISHKPKWYQIIFQAQFLGNTEGGSMPSTIVQAAPYTPLDVSQFAGILSASDNNTQAAMETIDNLTASQIPIADAGAYFTTDNIEAALQQLGAGGGGGLTQEQVEDIVGGMVTGNTETGIAVTYDDPTGKLNFDAQTAADGRYAPIAKGVTNGDTHDHSGGDGAQIAYSGLSGIPATFAPSAHATNHKSAGSDAIKLDELAAPTDVTTLDVSTTTHGLAPKAPNDATKYLDGTGAWTVPAGSGASTGPDKGFLATPGLHAANLTAVTGFATNSTYALYLGRAISNNPTLIARLRVTTLMSTITWAEIAIATGDAPAAGTANNLSTQFYLSATAVWNTIGIKTHAFTSSGISAGDNLWLLIGAQASVMPVFRGMLADDLQTGVFQTASGTRPSTMSAPRAFALCGATVVPPWIVVSQS